MINPERAAFSFLKFKVPSFSYNSPNDKDGELDILFDPSGIYYKDKGKFELKIVFKGVLVSGEEVINVVGISEFKFQEKINFEEIPDYFFSNSIAIVFPYLRSFVSTLTLQSNNGVIMLGLLNFTSMSSMLKGNTEIKNA